MINKEIENACCPVLRTGRGAICNHRGPCTKRHPPTQPAPSSLVLVLRITEVSAKATGYTWPLATLVPFFLLILSLEDRVWHQEALMTDKLSGT